MYRIITTEGAELGLADSVLFIKKSADGTFIESSQEDAIGLAYKGTAYNLPGHSEIEGAKTAVAVQVSAAQIMQEQVALSERLQANMDYIAMMAEVDMDGSATEAATEEQVWQA